MLVVVGAGLLNVNGRESVVPPPPLGDGVDTVTEAFPAVAMSSAGIVAFNWVEDTKVVGRSFVFHCTTESVTKLLPLTISVKAAPPAGRDVGLMLKIAGAGGLLIVKDRGGVEVPPSGAGLYTVT